MGPHNYAKPWTNLIMALCSVWIHSLYTGYLSKPYCDTSCATNLILGLGCSCQLPITIIKVFLFPKRVENKSLSRSWFGPSQGGMGRARALQRSTNSKIALRIGKLSHWFHQNCGIFLASGCDEALNSENSIFQQSLISLHNHYEWSISSLSE